MSGPAAASTTAAAVTLRESRRQLALDGLGIIATAIGFGLVYGLSAREAGLSLIEAMAMSCLVFAGAAQFAAVGALTQCVGWPAIVLLTAFLNARHLLYSAALAPWAMRTGRPTRAAMAHGLTDEAFALSIAHFRRIGDLDLRGYWYAAVVTVFIPWNLATLGGVLLGSAIADPAALGLDVVFPAAMAGLAVGLATSRRELVAAGVGAAIAVLASLVWAPSGGIIVGGLLGPLVAMLVPGGPIRRTNPVPLGIATEVDIAMTETDPDDPVGASGSEDPGRDPHIGVGP
jgi:4-azaleucine resistance transporter AzlC